MDWVKIVPFVAGVIIFTSAYRLMSETGSEYFLSVVLLAIAGVLCVLSTGVQLYKEKKVDI